jgi:AraC family transcriptional regulator, regulatory protein of adaptative response / methylated-DNA-[protein]-cysteine methyltransferase
MTMRSQPTSEVVRYSLSRTSVGNVFLAATTKGVCLLQIIEPAELSAALDELRGIFRVVELVEDHNTLRPVFRQVDAYLAGEACEDLALDLRGTAFQQKVWQALRRVPHGQTVSYTELAARAGRPRAVRAAASACGDNPVAIFVPCHRIVRRDGGLGGYRWGLQRKRDLLERERAAGLVPAV